MFPRFFPLKKMKQFLSSFNIKTLHILSLSPSQLNSHTHSHIPKYRIRTEGRLCLQQHGQKDFFIKSISTIFLFFLSHPGGATQCASGRGQVNKWTCKQTLALKYLPVKIASLVCEGRNACSIFCGPPPPLKNLIGHSAILPLKKNSELF